MRLSGWPRLGTLSEGIYIRPNHIKQRLGLFTAHCKKGKNEGGIKKKRELFQDEQDLHYSCEMEEEKCALYEEGGVMVGGGLGTPQILFEGHVMLACLRGCRVCQTVGSRSSFSGWEAEVEECAGGTQRADGTAVEDIMV